MAERLAQWPEFGLRDVHEMAAAGMSARQIARQAGAPLGSILSAAPECFEREEVREGPGFCKSCGKRLGEQHERCLDCIRSSWRELADRVRVLMATGAQRGEIAAELGISEGKVSWALGIATREGMHRQRRPTRARR